MGFRGNMQEKDFFEIHRGESVLISAFLQVPFYQVETTTGHKVELARSRSSQCCPSSDGERQPPSFPRAVMDHD